MSAEVEHTSNHIQTVVASPSSASASGSKISMFTKKSGFVIPKNKLSGSMIPVFRGTKRGDGETLNEEATNQIQRKTKWGPDLTRDAGVRKWRALAYQARVNQISQQLTLGALAIEDNQDSLSTSKFRDGKTSHLQLSQEESELLEFERREIIGELLKLNPAYKAPLDYKPLLKEANVPVPIKDYPGFNFIDSIFGPENDSLKRLEKETGAKIQVYGTKADKEGKFEVTPTDRNEINSAYEALYVHVSADTYEKIDSALALIELLVTPVSVKPLPSSTTSTAISTDNAITGQSQSMPILSVAPVLINQEMAQPYAGPLHQVGFPRHPHTSFLAGITQNSLFPLSGFAPTANSSAPLLCNPVQASSSNMPSYSAPLPVIPASFSPVPLNSSIVFPRSQPPHALQSQSMLQAPLPGQTGMLGNSPRPMFSDKSIPFAPEVPSLASNALASQNMVVSLPPKMNITNCVVSLVPSPFQSSGASFGNPGAALSYNSASQLQRGLPPLLTASEPVPSTIHPPSVGPMHPSIQPPVAMRATSPNVVPGSIPNPLTGISSASHPQAGLHNYVSGSVAKFDSMKPISTLIPRPQHASSSDFTFQPHRPQISAQVSWQSNQPASHNLTPAGQGPQSPLIRSLLPNLRPSQVHGFASPQASYQMHQPKALVSTNLVDNPAAPLVPPRGHNAVLSPAAQHMQQQNYFAPQLIGNPAGPYPPRAANQINFPGANPQGFASPHPRFNIPPGKPLSSGTQQVYDPFSPSASINTTVVGNAAKKHGESDPEYEDLMASVGVK